jgi:hypothetical protein
MTIGPPSGNKQAWSLMRALRALTWKHWAWATSIAMAVSLSIPLQKFEVNLYWAPWRVISSAPWVLLFAYVFLLAIVLAESHSPRIQRTASWRYVAAALVASVVCVSTMAAFSEFVQMPPREEFRGQVAARVGSPEVRQKLYAIVSLGLCDGVLHGWLATFIYVYLRNARIAAAALSEAQIRRSDAGRRLLASQLESAHAQVDPDEVLVILKGIQRAYEMDPAAADARMDGLIAFLRDAIPRLRSDQAMVAT